MSNSLHDDKTVILETDSIGGEKKEPEKTQKTEDIRKKRDGKAKHETKGAGDADLTDQVYPDKEDLDTTDEVEVDVDGVDTTDEVEVNVEGADTTDEVQIKKGDMDVTEETEAVVDPEEKTQLLHDVNGSDEKTDQYHGGETGRTDGELEDLGELDERTAEDICARGEGVCIHEEATRLLRADSKTNSEKTDEFDDSTCVQKHVLYSEDVWHRGCEKKRSKYLWLVAVVPVFLTIILVAWMKRSTGYVDAMTWLWALFIVFVGLGFGVFIWFGCSGWTMNCNDDKFESWWGVLVPLFKRSFPLGKFATVVLKPDEKVLSGAFSVCLSTSSPEDLQSGDREANHQRISEQVVLSPRGAILDYPTALRGARQIAIFLQLSIVDQSTGGALVRELVTFNRCVLDEWKRKGIKPEKQSVPTSLKAVFRRAKESVVLGRKTGENAIVWEVVFSRKHLVIEGKGFEIDNIEKMFVDDSPVSNASGRVDQAVVSGIHVFSGRNSAVFCKKSTRKEAEFVLSAIRSIFLGGSISEILGEVLAKNSRSSESLKSQKGSKRPHS